MKKGLSVFLAFLLALTFCSCSASDYKAAQELQSAGDYTAAQEAFRALGNYKDSELLASECGYAVASALFEAEDYAAAADAFRMLRDYSDSAAQAQECGYRIASALFDSGDFPGAMDAFAKLSGYRDSANRVAEASDRYLAEALIGSWTSDVMDESDIFLGDNLFSGEEGEEMKPYFEFEPFLNQYSLLLPEDGSFSLNVDTELFTRSTDAMLKSMRVGFHSYFVDTMIRSFETDGLSLEDAYKLFGVEDMDGIIEASLGMPLDDFIDLVFSRESLLEMIEECLESGTLSVEKGIILLKSELEDITATYDPATDTLSLTDDGRIIPFHRDMTD